MFDDFGQQALIHIFVNVLFLGITWWALQAVRFDVFLRDPKGTRAKVLQVLLTFALAHLLTEFFLSYYQSSQMLRYLF
ncbi:membrane protein [Alkalihalobacillus pseudalcaliphilus]|nr:membrane protein [Alkalihalobacillus pseudalcaliphilus]